MGIDLGLQGFKLRLNGQGFEPLGGNFFFFELFEESEGEDKARKHGVEDQEQRQVNQKDFFPEESEF